MRLLPPVLACLLAPMLCACPNKERQPQPQPRAVDWTDQQQGHQAGLELSLFRDTPMMASPPDAVSFSRDASLLWVHGLDRTTSEFYVSQLEVGEKSLTPLFHTQGPDLIVSYAQSSPEGDECLVLSQYQPKAGGPVRDVVYRVGDRFGEDLQWRSMVPWESIAGLPEIKEELFSFTEPFYSWDSGSILIPFKGATGVAVIDKRTGGGSFAAYPQTSISGVMGSAMGPLPDEDGARRAWASFWRQSGGEDECEVYTLDLETLEWERVFSLPWIAYQCAAPKPSVDPWLVWGSYSALLETDVQASEVQRSGTRIPRLARVVPGAGTQDLLATYGEPIWEIALAPEGGYVFYADMQRQALARLNPASGELDIDPRWYTADDQRTGLFIASGGERCFIWQGEILIEAQWQSHEEFQGYDE